MSIIILGTIDKKLFFPLIYIIIYAGIIIYWNNQDYNIISFYIEKFGYSIGQFLAIFMNKAFKYKRIVKPKKTLEKNYFKYYSFLALITIFYFLSELFETIFRDDSISELYVNDAIEIIFLTLITYFILKYKYYKHHIISISAFVLLSVIIDILVKNFSRANTFLVFNSIFYVLADSLLYSYYKYLFESKYYYFLDVLVIEGIMYLIISVISFLIILLVQSISDSKTLITLFSEYYEQFNIWKIIFQFFFSLIITGFSGCLLEFIIVKELTPNYVIIGYELSKIPASIIINEGINRWIVLVISIFQIICLLFYLEIVECNFCSVNNNTRKSISERGERQEETNYLDDNEIVYKGYDITYMVNQKENIYELEEK